MQCVTSTICVRSEICARLRKHRRGAKVNKHGYFYYWSEKRLLEAASMILHHSQTLIVKIEGYSYACLKTRRSFSLSKKTYMDWKNDLEMSLRFHYLVHKIGARCIEMLQLFIFFYNWQRLFIINAPEFRNIDGYIAWPILLYLCWRHQLQSPPIFLPQRKLP